MMDRRLWQDWKAAAERPAVDAALRDLYAQIDAAVAERGPTCWASGKCCKFDEFGHRLYVTGLEIAWFLNQVEQDGAGADAGVRYITAFSTEDAYPRADQGRCPPDERANALRQQPML